MSRPQGRVRRITQVFSQVFSKSFHQCQLNSLLVTIVTSQVFYIIFFEQIVNIPVTQIVEEITEVNIPVTQIVEEITEVNIPVPQIVEEIAEVSKSSIEWRNIPNFYYEEIKVFLG